MDTNLEEAAMDLYATRWQTFWRVTFPQILPGIIGGALLAITLSLDDVVVTQFSAGPGATTLPVRVFSLIRKGVTPIINAVSVVMLVASLLLVVVSLIVGGLRSGSTPVATTTNRSRLPGRVLGEGIHHMSKNAAAPGRNPALSGCSLQPAAVMTTRALLAATAKQARPTAI